MLKKLHPTITAIKYSGIFKLLLIPLIFVSFAHGALSAKPVNLNRGDVYVRRGFDRSWTDKMPEGKEWLKIVSPEKMRSFRIKELGLKGTPKRGMFSLKTFKDEDFTFLFPFTTGTNFPGFPGVYIQDMGVKWEVYINGKQIIHNFSKREKSSSKKERSLRKILTYIDPHYLKKENNIVAFRIRGNPADPITGFYRNRIVIDDYETLDSERSEVITLVLIFIYLSFGIYNLFLYINSGKEPHYLFFSLASIAYFLYIFSKTRSIYTVFSSPYIVTKLEFITLYTLAPLFGSFIELIIFRRVRRFTRIYSLFAILLIALTLFTPLAFSFDVLRIWQFTALVPLLYYAIPDIGLTFFNRTRVRYAGTEGEKRFRIFFKTLFRTLGKTVEGNLVIGIFIVTGCVVFDILDSVYFNYGFMASRYGFFFFITGTGLNLSNRLLFMLKKIESLNRSLTKKIEDLNSANTAITLSEEKYRTLVEGSNDMIFSLDENLMFISANRSLKRVLDVDDRELREKSFMDLFMNNDEGKTISLQLIREKIDFLINKRIPVQFTTYFRSRFRAESQEMHVRLECINAEGKNEILGKATRIVEDSLLKYFVSEKQCFEIGNFLIIADEISHRITKNLQKYMEQVHVDVVRIAVREIIVNAIEHGNLEISYDEKNEAMNEGKFFELFSLRQQDHSFRNRKVKIEYKIDSSRVQYRIEDEGNGFDYRALFENANKANIEMRSHGRGILMAKNVFDSIEYNNKGNQVLLIKNF